MHLHTSQGNFREQLGQWTVICLFLGLMTVDLFARPVVTKLALSSGTFALYLGISVLNGLVVAILSMFLEWWRCRVVSSLALACRINPRERILRMGAIGFICGAMALAYVLSLWGLFALTMIIILLTLAHMRRFMHGIAALLRPNRRPSWQDIGFLVHIYITVLAALTTLTISLELLSFSLGQAPSFHGAIMTGEATMIDAFYFSIVVMTTLGFGDITPATPAAKLLVSFMCLTGYAMFALIIGVVTRGITNNEEDD